MKLIGKDSYESALGIVSEKGMVYVPVMYLLPIFPDDAICMVCGMLKVKFWVHLIEIILCRGIGVATIVFGIGILPKELIEGIERFDWAFIGSHIWDYIVLVTVLVFWVTVLLKIARKVDKWLTKRINKKNTLDGDNSGGDDSSGKE